ncbi:hypothetical protein AALC17_10265 [Oscillospiraceae bacterium 38-13]
MKLKLGLSCAIIRATNRKAKWRYYFHSGVGKPLKAGKQRKSHQKRIFLRMRVAGIIGMVIISVVALTPTLIAHFDK